MELAGQIASKMLLTTDSELMSSIVTAEGVTAPHRVPAGGQQRRPVDPPDRLGNLGRVGARWLHCASPNINSRKRSYPRNARGVGCPFGSNVTCTEADGEDR